MAKQMTILDIGSSKVVCLICCIDEGDTLVVQGAGVKGYKGYRKGRFISENSLANAVIEAVTGAENEAKRRARSIVVGVNAPFCHVGINKGGVKVSSQAGRVTERDIHELITSSYKEPPVGFELIQSTPVCFKLDDGECEFSVPIGKNADIISGTISHVAVESDYKSLVRDILSELKIEISNFVAVPQALGAFLIPPEEITKDVFIVDVGSTHTDVILQNNGAIIDMRTIDAGGMHITTDISYIFGTSLRESERIKRNHTFGLDCRGTFIDVKNDADEVMTVNAVDVQDVIDARVMELADMIAVCADNMGLPCKPSQRIYFTGGGIALMRGSMEFLSKYLDIEAVNQMPWMPRLSSQNYASAYAVMMMALKRINEMPSSRSMMDRIKNLFVQ